MTFKRKGYILILSNFILSLLIQSVLGSEGFKPFSFNEAEINHYRKETKKLFYFAYNNYLKFGYPYDELRPISCVPKTRNFTNSEDIITNDVLGNFTITLVDSLTTLAIFGDILQFKEAIRLIDKAIPIDCDIDSTVQVFETTIRLIGGFISGHLYATDPSKHVFLGDMYDGSLLQRAKNLADRLIPSYLTRTGLPLPRINLRSKLSKFTSDMINENNAAAMACPMLEFTMLSYLTHDEKYQKLSRYAFDKTWSFRSRINLLPMLFNPGSGNTYLYATGIGASIDSFYEYALKGAILFDDSKLYKVWSESYRALKTYTRGDWFYTSVQTETGQVVFRWIDSLSAFFSGTQVLDGEIRDAQYKHLMFMKIWNTYGGLPERWNFQIIENDTIKTSNISIEETISLEWYPLRPEFAESTYFLYRATKDPFYLNVGLRLLNDISTKFRHQCGFGGYQNIVTGEPQDRMESFFLGETLKYLYLLFDEDNELHTSRSNYIFTTEAHPFWLTNKMKSDYNNKKYFNDTIYLNHWNRLQVGKKAPRYFLKRLFSNRFIDRNQDETFSIDKKNEYLDNTCSIYDKPISNLSNKFYYSEMLNNFPRLFEVDYRYNHVMVKPDHMKKYIPIELTQEWYEKWSDHRIAYCALQPNTESFELYFETNTINISNPLIVQKGNMFIRSYSSLNGAKMRLEKLTPGSIDTNGDVIPSSLFNNISSFNIYRNTCQEYNQLSPTCIYRLTMINGDCIGNDTLLLIKKDSLFTVENESLTSFLGYNSENQILFQCIPVINIVLI